MSVGVLPRWVKAGYGLAQTGTNASEVLLRLYLLIFYTDVVGLEPALAGYATALAIIWDGFTDPLMGVISDRTRTRWGRRRPWIVLGGALLAICLYLVFTPPTLETQGGKFAFLLFSYMLVNTASTIIGIPHSALGSELTADRTQITEIYGWRLIFGNVGAIAGTIIPGAILTSLAGTSTADRSLAHAHAALLIGGLIVVSAGMTWLATSGRDHLPIVDRHVAKPSRIRIQLRAMLANRPFLILLSAYLVATIGTAINSTFAFYYYKYRLLLTEQQTQKIIAFFIVIFCIALVGWIVAANRYDKKRLLFFGAFSLGCMTVIGYPLFPAREEFWPLAAGVLGGILVGSILLLDAMLIDCIDYDTVRTREAKSGLYFGIWLMAGKMSRAIAVALSGKILSLIGFAPNTEQTSEVSRKIALTFGPGVGSFFIGGALIALLFPLTSKHVEKIRRIVDKRSARLAATRAEA